MSDSPDTEAAATADAHTIDVAPTDQPVAEQPTDSDVPDVPETETYQHDIAIVDKQADNTEATTTATGDVLFVDASTAVELEDQQRSARQSTKAVATPSRPTTQQQQAGRNRGSSVASTNGADGRPSQQSSSDSDSDTESGTTSKRSPNQPLPTRAVLTQASIFGRSATFLRSNRITPAPYGSDANQSGTASSYQRSIRSPLPARSPLKSQIRHDMEAAAGEVPSEDASVYITPAQRRQQRIYQLVTLACMTVTFGWFAFSYVWLLYKDDWYQLTYAEWSSDWRAMAGCILHCVATAAWLVVAGTLMCSQKFANHSLYISSIQHALLLYCIATALFTSPQTSTQMLTPLYDTFTTAVQAQWIGCICAGLVYLYLLFTLTNHNQSRADTMLQKVRGTDLLALQKLLRQVRSEHMEQLNSTRNNNMFESARLKTPVKAAPAIAEPTEVGVMDSYPRTSQLIESVKAQYRPPTGLQYSSSKASRRTDRPARASTDQVRSGVLSSLVQQEVRKALQQVGSVSDRRRSGTKFNAPLIADEQTYQQIEANVVHQLAQRSSADPLPPLRTPSKAVY